MWILSFEFWRPRVNRLQQYRALTLSLIFDASSVLAFSFETQGCAKCKERRVRVGTQHRVPHDLQEERPAAARAQNCNNTVVGTKHAR